MTDDVRITDASGGRRRASGGLPWEPKVGYSRAVRAFTRSPAGTVGVNADGTFPTGVGAQTRRALAIIRAAIGRSVAVSIRRSHPHVLDRLSNGRGRRRARRGLRRFAPPRPFRGGTALDARACRDRADQSSVESLRRARPSANLGASTSDTSGMPVIPTASGSDVPKPSSASDRRAERAAGAGCRTPSRRGEVQHRRSSTETGARLSGRARRRSRPPARGARARSSRGQDPFPSTSPARGVHAAIGPPSDAVRRGHLGRVDRRRFHMGRSGDVGRAPLCRAEHVVRYLAFRARTSGFSGSGRMSVERDALRSGGPLQNSSPSAPRSLRRKRPSVDRLRSD